MAAEEADKDEAELQPELLRQTQQVYSLCCCKACESQPLLVRVALKFRFFHTTNVSLPLNSQ